MPRTCFHRSSKGCHQSDLERLAFRPPQQDRAAEEENNVRQPGPERGRYFPLAREGNAQKGNRIVGEHQHDREHESRRLAPFFRGEPKRDADQRQHQASRGQRETAVKLDVVPASRGFIGLASFPRQIPGTQLRNGGRLLFLLAAGLGERDRNIPLLEGRNPVEPGIFGFNLMSGSVGQVQMQFVGPFADQNALLGKRDAGS